VSVSALPTERHDRAKTILEERATVDEVAARAAAI
jgi:hypothetical protein